MLEFIHREPSSAAMTKVRILLPLFMMLDTTQARTQPTASLMHRIIFATTDHGSVYYHGHRLPPPYTISAGFRLVDGDTLWEQLYINNYPLVHKMPPRTLTPGDSLSIARYAALGAASTNALQRERPKSRNERLRIIAKAYASVDSLVDSAVVVSSDNVINLYWKGRREPEGIDISDSPSVPRTQSSRLLRDLAWGTYAPTLAAGSALVFADGGVTTVPRLRVSELEREVAGVRRGLSADLRILDPFAAEEFRHPKPLPPPEQ